MDDMTTSDGAAIIGDDAVDMDNGRTRNDFLKTIISIAVPLLLTFVASLFTIGFYNHDQWFMLANGRYVMEHGFPYGGNPFNDWGGSGFVMENWLWSVLVWLAWSWTGSSQIGIWLLVLVVIETNVLMVYGIASVIHGSRTQSCVSGVLAGLFLITCYSVRPAVISVSMILASMLVTVIWLKTRKPVWLILLIPIMVLAFNMHMAMAWYVILVPGCFMLADVILDKDVRGHNLAWYVLTVSVTALATLLNPWSSNGTMFLFRSYGAAKLGGMYQPEMNNLVTCLSDDSCRSAEVYQLLPACLVLLMTLMSLVSIVMSFKSMNTNDRILSAGSIIVFLGLSIASFLTVRSVAEFILLIPLLATVWLSRLDRLWLRCLFSSGLVIMYALVAMTAQVITLSPAAMPWNADSSVQGQFVVQAVKELEKTTGRNESVASSWPFNSVLIYEGYRPSVDPRPELMSSGLSGLPKNHYEELIEASETFDGSVRYVNTYKDRYAVWLFGKVGQYANISEALADNDDFEKVKDNGLYVIYRSKVVSTDESNE